MKWQLVESQFREIFSQLIFSLSSINSQKIVISTFIVESDDQVSVPDDR